MRDCTYAQAERIYLLRYWEQPGFDKVRALHPLLSIELFDWGVTSGPTRSSSALQRALNSLNREAADYPDVVADGRIGPVTRYALEQFLVRRGIEGGRYLLELVQALRRVFYLEISERDQSQERFSNGWQSRVR